jgi:hypothetical protein
MPPIDDFHDSFCFKTHKRLGLAVFAIWTFLSAVSAYTLLTRPNIPTESGIFHSWMTLNTICALFIACSLFRDAKCTSERVIVGCLTASIALGLMAQWNPATAHTLNKFKLALDIVILVSIATDLRVAYSHG